MVQGVSKENLRNKETLTTGPKDLTTRETKSYNDQRNKPPNSIVSPAIRTDVTKETKSSDPVEKQCKNITTQKCMKAKPEHTKPVQAKLELNTIRVPKAEMGGRKGETGEGEARKS